jgi:hypothetical protein
LKKLLIALGLSSALILSPALAQTSDQTTPPAASDASKTPMKPMKAKTTKHKAHTKPKAHAKAKPKKMAPKPKTDAPADAPKT